MRVELTVAAPSDILGLHYPNGKLGGLTVEGPAPGAVGQRVEARVFNLVGQLAWARHRGSRSLKALRAGPRPEVKDRGGNNGHSWKLQRLRGMSAPRATCLRMRLRALGIATTLVSTVALAAPTPQDLKAAITFIYGKPRGADGGVALEADGGFARHFFVGIEGVGDKAGGMFIRLVTAKHVVEPFFGKSVSFRHNAPKGDALFRELKLFTSGNNKNVFLHPNPAVDIAVIVAETGTLVNQINLETMNLKVIPIDMVPTRERFAATAVEGADVFFAAMFVQTAASKNNLPMFRFGRVALAPTEPLTLDGRTRELLIVECRSEPGNSGAPVFLNRGSDREAGSLQLGPPELLLGGVMLGTFIEPSVVKVPQVPEPVAVAFAEVGNGLALVTPGYLIREILMGTVPAPLRGAQTPRAK